MSLQKWGYTLELQLPVRSQHSDQVTVEILFSGMEHFIRDIRAFQTL